MTGRSWPELRSIVRIGLINILLTGCLIVLLEGVLFLCYQFPVGTTLVRTARDYYLYCDRITATYEEDQGRYDPQVDYTYQPGEFTFRNREYSVRHVVNSLGLRDDEGSLQAPDVIVLGDSHAGGWGVEQEASFPELIASETGLNVLNTAIPSFATPRQVRMLSRLDRTRLKVLVIQYSENDFPENKWFREHGNTPHTMSRQEYESNRQAYHAVNRAYFPFKYLRVYWPMLFRNLTVYHSATSIPVHILAKREPAKEAAAFLNVLLNGDVDLGGVPVVVLEIVSYNWNTNGFVRALDSLAQASEYAQHPRLPRIVTVDVSGVLRNGDYYVFDDHMNSRGHRHVADKLVPVIRCLAEGGKDCGESAENRAED